MITNEQAKQLIWLQTVKEIALDRAREHPNMEEFNIEYARAAIAYFEYLIDLVKD